MPFFLARIVKRLNRGQSAKLLALALVSIVLGAGLFSITQHVTYGVALYWAFTTASTVGYGDVTPHNNVGRVIAVGEMVTAIPLFAGVFAGVTATFTSLQLRSLFGMDHALPDQPYTLVFGSHSLIPRVLSELEAREFPVVLVRDPATGLAEVPEGVHVISGDPASEAVIVRAQPAKAREALLATTTDGEALIIAVILRKLAPQLPVIAVVSSPDVASALQDLGVTQTLSVDELVGHALAKSLETPHASDLLLQMLGNSHYRLAEQEVGTRWQGQSLTAIRSQAEEFVLGAVVSGVVMLGVGEDPVLGAEDRLLVLTV